MPNIKRNKELYQKLLREIGRLKNTNFPEMENDFFNEFIYGQIPDVEIVKIFRKHLKIEMPYVLSNEIVYSQTVKILALMESSQDIKELKTLIHKKEAINKSKRPEITGFDKILKGMLNVPPPKKEKK